MSKVLGVTIALIIAVAPCYGEDAPKPSGSSPQAIPTPVPNPLTADPYKALSDSLSEQPHATVNDNECSASATIDYRLYLDNLPVFREHWLNRDYSFDYYGSRAQSVLTLIVMKRLASSLTQYVYVKSRPKTDCAFSAYVKYNDKYGQSKIIKLITWKFTNNIAMKMNWDNSDDTKFDSIADDYNATQEADDWDAEGLPLSSDGKFYPAHHPDDECSDILFNANATFIRATTFCRKDYMDSKAGYTALEASKACFKKFDEATLKRAAMAAMKRLDENVRLHGRRAACADVENLSREIDNGKR